MKNNSTMAWYEYLLELIWMGLVSMIWFKNLLFRCLPGMTYIQSKGILWGMLAVSIVAGTFILFRYMRTGWTAVVCVILPFGLFTVLTYAATVKGLIVAALIAAAVVSVIYTAVLMSRKIQKEGSTIRRRIHINRLYRCLCFSQSSIAVALLAIMLFLGGRGIFGTTIMNASIKATVGSTSQEQTISNNIDTVLLLQEEEWDRLSVAERIDVLQCIANIEARYLGLQNELNVGASNLSEGTLGCYADRTHTIYISLDHIEKDPVYSVLETLCHEAFHSYEHRLVDEYNKADESARNLKIYRRVAHYAEEFDNYIDGDEYFCGYYYQYCESDSRDYAEEAVYDYYEKIYDYLNDPGVENADE